MSILSWLVGSFLCYINTLDLVRSRSARAIQKTFQLLEKPEHQGTKLMDIKENHVAKTWTMEKIVLLESRAVTHRDEAARVLQLIIPQGVSNYKPSRESHDLQHLHDSVVTAAPVTQREVLLPTPSKSH